MISKEKFTILVLSAEQTLYRVAISMLKNEADVKDAVQQAILLAFERISTLKNEEYFTTWIVRILINVCKKQLKRERLHDIDIYQPADTYTGTDDVDIRLVVESLPLKYRQVVVLYYTENFKVNEIAKALSIPQGTVKSRLHKARELLKEEL